MNGYVRGMGGEVRGMGLGTFLQ